jgi:hypothetical protein
MFSHYWTAKIGGLGGRPSPLVARHPDLVQSSKHRYSTASPDGSGTSSR